MPRSQTTPSGRIVAKPETRKIPCLSWVPEQVAIKQNHKIGEILGAPWGAELWFYCGGLLELARSYLFNFNIVNERQGPYLIDERVNKVRKVTQASKVVVLVIPFFVRCGTIGETQETPNHDGKSD